MVAITFFNFYPVLNMSPLSPLFALLALSVALITTFVIKKVFGAPATQGRFATIDGLRGYLAFFVFLHHSSIWYFYLQNGKWEAPHSNLFTQFGQASVMLFFMITSFLFYTKLLDSKAEGVHWGRFFVSRILRLAPLYLFAMAILFMITAFRTHWIQYDSTWNIAKSVGIWIAFTILGTPEINGIDPRIVMAGVTWSLPYEWFFYLALPIIALSVRMMPPLPYIALSVAGIVMARIHGTSPYYILAFCGGIGAAILVRFEIFRRLSQHLLSSAVVLACLGVVFTLFPTSHGILPLLLLSAAFAFIAGGAGLFGALKNSTSRTFGETAYGIYLLHGITLFVSINYVADSHWVGTLTPTSFWLFISTLTPVLVGICFCTFKLIEAPAMRQVNAVMQLIGGRKFAH